MSEPRASLVESIPVGMEDLRCISGVQFTEDALARLTGTAQSTIDLTAMYWALLPDPKGDDEKGFDEEDFSRMRAGAGQKLYGALGDAAARGVTIRILQSPGFSKSEQKGQSERLRDEFPARVFIHTVDMGAWYGGSGIMHQKIWIFDARHLYLGSANMDWKSISQVKEMGVAVEDCPELAADAGNISKPGGPSAPSLRPASKSSIPSSAFTAACHRGRLWRRPRSAPNRRSPAINTPPPSTARPLNLSN